MKRLNTGNDREDWNVEAGMLIGKRVVADECWKKARPQAVNYCLALVSEGSRSNPCAPAIDGRIRLHSVSQGTTIGKHLP